MICKITNRRNGDLISQKAKVANNLISRMVGLMFRKVMDKEEALIFYLAPSIHTCFMRFPIDLIFLDKERKIIRICEALKPWRAVLCAKSFITIELPPYKAEDASLKLGDVLEITSA